MDPGSQVPPSPIQNLMTSFLAAIMTILLSWRYLLEADDRGISDVTTSRQTGDLPGRNRPRNVTIFPSVKQGAPIAPASSRADENTGEINCSTSYNLPHNTWSPGTKLGSFARKENGDTNCTTATAGDIASLTACAPVIVASPVLSDRRRMAAEEDETVDFPNRYRPIYNEGASAPSDQGINDGSCHEDDSPGANWTGLEDSRRKQRVLLLKRTWHGGAGSKITGVDSRPIVNSGRVNNAHSRASLTLDSEEGQGSKRICHCDIEPGQLDYCDICQCHQAGDNSDNDNDTLTSETARDPWGDLPIKADDDSRNSTRALNCVNIGMDDSNLNRGKPLKHLSDAMEFNRKSNPRPSNVHDRIQACSRRTYGISNNIQQKFNDGINKALYQLASYEPTTDADHDLDTEDKTPSFLEFKSSHDSFYDFDDVFSNGMSSRGQGAFKDVSGDDGGRISPAAKIPKRDDPGFYSTTFLGDSFDSEPLDDQLLAAPADTIAKIGSIEDLLSHEMSFDCDDLEASPLVANDDDVQTFSGSNSNSSTNSDTEREAEISEFYDRTLDTITEEDSDDIEEYTPEEEGHVTITSVPWWKLDQVDKYGGDMTDSYGSDEDGTPRDSPVSVTLRKYSSDGDLSSVGIKTDLHERSSPGLGAIPKIKIHAPKDAHRFENYDKNESGLAEDIQSDISLEKGDDNSENSDTTICSDDVADKTTEETDADGDMNSIRARASFFEANISKEDTTQTGPVLKKENVKSNNDARDNGRGKFAADGQIPSVVDSVLPSGRRSEKVSDLARDKTPIRAEGGIILANFQSTENDSGPKDNEHCISGLINVPNMPRYTNPISEELTSVDSSTGDLPSWEKVHLPARASPADNWEMGGGPAGIGHPLTRDKSALGLDEQYNNDGIDRAVTGDAGPGKKPAHSCLPTSDIAGNNACVLGEVIQRDGNNYDNCVLNNDSDARRRDISPSPTPLLPTGVTQDIAPEETTGKAEKTSSRFSQIPGPIARQVDGYLDTAQQATGTSDSRGKYVVPGPSPSSVGNCLPNCDSNDGHQRSDLGKNISARDARESDSEISGKHWHISPDTGGEGIVVEQGAALSRSKEHHCHPRASLTSPRDERTNRGQPDGKQCVSTPVHDCAAETKTTKSDGGFVFKLPPTSTQKTSYTFTIPSDNPSSEQGCSPPGERGISPVTTDKPGTTGPKVDVRGSSEDTAADKLRSPASIGQSLMNTNAGSPRPLAGGIRVSCNRIDTSPASPASRAVSNSISEPAKLVTQNIGGDYVERHSLLNSGLTGDLINPHENKNQANLARPDNSAKLGLTGYVTRSTPVAKSVATTDSDSRQRGIFPGTSTSRDRRSNVGYNDVQTPDTRSNISTPDLLWGGVSVGPLQAYKGATVGVYNPAPTCTAMATSTALARRESPQGSPRSADGDTSGAVISAVARAEATAENPYIAVARASARAASVATASATNALTDPGDEDADPEQTDINVVISTSCTLRGQDQELHQDSEGILDSLGDLAQVNVHSVGAPKHKSKSGSRIKALTDASTQSSPDINRGVITPNTRRKLKITIEHPQSPDGSRKEIRTLECDLPVTNMDMDVTSVISDAVRQILQSNSQSLPHGFMSTENFDKTVKKVTEHVIHAYKPQSDPEPTAQASKVIDEEAPLPKPVRKKKKPKNSDGKEKPKQKSKKSKNPEILYVATPYEENYGDAQPVSPYSEEYNLDHAPFPEIRMNNSVVPPEQPNTDSTPTKVKKVKKNSTDKLKKKKVKRLQFVEIDTVTVEKLPEDDQQVTAEVVNIGKGGKVDVSDSQDIVFVKEKKTKKVKKNGKLKGILKNATPTSPDPMTSDSADKTDKDAKTNTQEDELDSTDRSNPFKEDGVICTEVRASRDISERNYIDHIYDSGLDKSVTASHGPLQGKQECSTSGPERKSILKKQGTSELEDMLSQRSQRQKQEKRPYRSVLQEPVADENTSATVEHDSDQLPQENKEPPSSRKRILHSRKNYLTEDKTDSKKSNEYTVKQATTSDPPKAPKQAPEPPSLFVVDINFDSAPKPDINKLKETVLSARPKAPAAPFSDSVWNAGIAAARSIDTGLNTIDGDAGFTKKYSTRSLPASTTDSPVRKAKSLGTLPNQYLALATDDAQSPFVEASVDTDMTPAYFETNLDEKDPEKSKSMINLQNKKIVDDEMEDPESRDQYEGLRSGALQNGDEDMRSKSASELRISQSLSKLSVPDWYKHSPRREQEIVILKHARPNPSDQVDYERGRVPWKINRSDVTNNVSGTSSKPVVIQQSFSYRPSIRGRSPVMRESYQEQTRKTFELPSSKLRSKSQERLLFSVTPYEETRLQTAPHQQQREAPRSAKEAYIEIRERSKSRERGDFQWKPVEIRDHQINAPQVSGTAATNGESGTQKRIENRQSRSRMPYVGNDADNIIIDPPLEVEVQSSSDRDTVMIQDSLISPKDSGLGSSFTSTPHSPTDSQIQARQQENAQSRDSEESIYQNMGFQAPQTYIQTSNPPVIVPESEELQQSQITVVELDTQDTDNLPRTRRKKVSNKDPSEKKTQGKKSRKRAEVTDVTTQEALQALLLPQVDDRVDQSIDRSLDYDNKFVDIPAVPTQQEAQIQHTSAVLQQQRVTENIDTDNLMDHNQDPIVISKKPRKVKSRKKMDEAGQQTRGDQQKSTKSSGTKGSFENLLDGLLVLDNPPTTLMCNIDENNKINSSFADTKMQPLERALAILKLKDDLNETPNTENITSLYAVHGSPQLEIKPSHVQESSDGDVTVKCRNTKCGLVAILEDARATYKTCHNCYTYYCSRDCRKAHWERHKKKCHYSRVNSACKHVVKKSREDEHLSKEIARVARAGYLSRGRGCVMLAFSSIGAAENFLQHGLVALETPPVYVAIGDFQDVESLGEHFFDLTELCKTYNPELKCVLEVAIVTGSPDVQTSHYPPRREGPVIKKCVKVRLNSDIIHSKSKDSETMEQDTLILTAVPGSEFTENMEERKAREICFVNIQRKLRQRGVSLRHQFPDVYNQLCSYVADNLHFTPITIYPVDANTGRKFMCLIMPESEPDVEWSNRTDLLDQLGLSENVDRSTTV